mgnify:CR=1 FL=1
MMTFRRIAYNFLNACSEILFRKCVVSWNDISISVVVLESASDIHADITADPNTGVAARRADEARAILRAWIV